MACIIPAYNEARHIAEVIASVSSRVDHVIVVDDASTDTTRQVVKEIDDSRVVLVEHAENQGVGGAVVSGYREALRLGADIMVKVDGDGQMDASQIARLVKPLAAGEADYSKGVRFRDLEVVRRMPIVRLIGNFVLSFLTKVASGYWNIFDPTNGFTAITRQALELLPLDRVSRGFFFESDMLIHLYLVDAVVADVPMRARYGSEESHLNPLAALVTFPVFLLRGTCRRILWRYFIRDFSAFSAFLLVGAPLFAFGVIFGAYKWWRALESGQATPTGTVVLVAVTLILGFQLLLQAVVLDIHNVPKKPLTSEADE